MRVANARVLITSDPTTHAASFPRINQVKVGCTKSPIYYINRCKSFVYECTVPYI